MLKSREIYVITFIFILGVIGHFFAADFLKAMAVYPDEMRYYLSAQSLFKGTGNMIYNLPSAYQKLGYALFLVPFFAISDTLLRLRAIALGNACLVMSAVFFVYFLAKEIKLKTRDCYLLVLLTAVCPVTMLVMGFMSETLYFPLVMAFFYVYVLNERKQSYVLAVVCGVLGYLGYVTKEIFLSLIIAMILTEVWGLVTSYTKGLKQAFSKRLRLLTVSVSVYLGLFVLFKMLYFYGLGNSYNQMGLGPVMSWHGVGYFLYALADYAAAMLVCYFVLPPIMTIVGFRYADHVVKKMTIFLLLTAVIAGVAVTYTILIREDLQYFIPRLHLRYVAPLVIPFVMLCLKAWDEFSYVRDGRLLVWLTVCALLFIGTIFAGTIVSSAADQQDLYWYTGLRDKIGYIERDGGGFLFVGVWTVNILIAVVVGSFVWMMKTTFIKRAKYLFVFLIFVLMTYNSVAVHRSFLTEYGVTEEQVAEMRRLNDFFADKKGNIVFFSNYPYRSRMLFDTYFQYDGEVFTVEGWETLRYGDYMEFNLSDYTLNDAWLRRPYTKLHEADWIILDKSLQFGYKHFIGVTEVSGVGGKMFDVYHNSDKKYIRLDHDYSLAYNGGELYVYFDGKQDNSRYYVMFGIYQSEDDRGWTDRDKMAINVPSLQSTGKVGVEIKVAETFLNKKFDYTLSHGDKPFKDGSIQGAGVIRFELPIERNMIYFEMNIKNTFYVYEALPFRGDITELSLKIDNIRIYPLSE